MKKKISERLILAIIHLGPLQNAREKEKKEITVANTTYNSVILF